jgi:hypothetical protein
MVDALQSNHATPKISTINVIITPRNTSAAEDEKRRRKRRMVMYLTVLNNITILSVSVS